MTTAFSTLSGLPASQLDNLNALGYHQMTAIQAATLPEILAGRDVRAQAKTGSGKTAAFGLGVMQRLDVNLRAVQALVLCPTRELAEQVSQELRRLARFAANIKITTLTGGQSLSAQREGLVHAPHVLVATPGRLLDHLNRQSLQLGELKMLVLDEADRMLEMGFRSEMETVMAACPEQRQTLLFSATWPDDIARLSQRYQRDPLAVESDNVTDLPAVEQRFYELSSGEKTRMTLRVLSHDRPSSCVVFCNTKRECDDLVNALTQQSMSALALHGDLEQRDRDQVLIRFANGSARVLVATDVAARGLDIPALAMVINYQLAWDPEVHVHRIGRTARAGEQGVAISLVAADEMVRAHALEDFLRQPLNWQSPQALLQEPVKPLLASMVTIGIDGGRKAKIRPGDILGALTGEGGIDAQHVGKISLTATHAWVAIDEKIAKKALTALLDGKLKGKRCRAFLLK